MAMDTDYAATYTITDVINNSADAQATAVDNTGMSQGALYAQLNSIITNWNLTMTKIEADDATTTTYTPDNAYTTLASRGIELNGMHQLDLYNALAEIETNFSAVLALLDADGGVTKTNYAATVNALGTASALALPATVSGNGISQEDIVEFLDDYITKYNGLLTHLDTDGS